jgi:hypothetical protein
MCDKAFVATQIKVRKNPLVYVTQVHLNQHNSISTHDPEDNLVRGPLVAMSFLDRINGELAPLLQSPRPASLDLLMSEPSAKDVQNRAHSTFHPRDSESTCLSTRNSSCI